MDQVTEETLIAMGWRMYGLATLILEMAERIRDLERRPPVIVVVQRAGGDVYDGEAEDVGELPEGTG